MKRRFGKGALACVSAVALVAMSSLPASADGRHGYGPRTEAFRFIYPLETIPWYPAEDMVKNCGGTYDHAKAKITYEQRGGKTHVYIRVKKTVPNTFWTVWLRTDTGSTSPLTGMPITALANPGDVGGLVKYTAHDRLTQEALDLGLQGDDGTGTAVDVANGFWTDRWGYGEFRAKLDYPLVKGAFQWQEFDSSLARSAIGTAPFRVRVVSHCVDQVGHGLLPGIPPRFHEMWFDW